MLLLQLLFFLFIHLAWASEETISACGWVGGPGVSASNALILAFDPLSAHSELPGERVVELLHRDSAVTVVVEFAHQHMLLVVRHVDVKPRV